MDSERRPLRVTRLLTAAAVVLVGCAQGGTTTTTSPLIVPTRPVVVPDSATFVRVHADSVRHPYTAADVQFMSGMIPHHSQAIAMARMTPTHGASPAIRRLADRIINAQLDEIVTMQQWLADRRQRVPEARPGPMKMVMNGMEHEMLMPGMLTDAQMLELGAARGVAFDRLFLKYMIQHHSGAVSMVRDLFGSYGAGQDETVFKFASDVNVDQTTEIARMEQMLASLSSSTNSQRN